MNEKSKRYYYYASERGCMKDPEAVDEIGIGIEGGKESCSLIIRLMRLRDRFTMQASAHNDEWRVFVACRDVLDLLSERASASGEMKNEAPFYALRTHLERLGYKNLGVLVE